MLHTEKKKAKLHRYLEKRGLDEVKGGYVEVVKEGVQGYFYFVTTGSGEGRGVAVGYE